MIAAKARRIPWSIVLHGPDEFFDPDAFYLRRRIEPVRFVVCVGDFCRSKVLWMAPDPDGKRLEVVRVGVDCANLNPIAQAQLEASAQGNQFRNVCAGRRVAAKEHRIFVAGPYLLASGSVDFCCTLSDDGPERSSLELLCEPFGIAVQVRFLGAVTRQPTLSEIAKADVFVLASFAEGLPVALTEAMALGVPCVSTVIAGFPELIQGRRIGCGFLLQTRMLCALR
jgi:colanic acid/amylovoran biosynthesis glycosyltransferase